MPERTRHYSSLFLDDVFRLLQSPFISDRKIMRIREAIMNYVGEPHFKADSRSSAILDVITLIQPSSSLVHSTRLVLRGFCSNALRAREVCPPGIVRFPNQIPTHQLRAAGGGCI